MRAKVLSGITALTSFSRPSAPYILPPARIIAGIEASTMTSLGEWKLVMPLAESTIASSGRCSWQACRSRIDLLALRLRQGGDLVVQVDHAVVDVDAELVEQLAVLRERVLVEDRTQWPNTIGCETFIIVALTCSENITPVLRASSISLFVEVAAAPSCS